MRYQLVDLKEKPNGKKEGKQKVSIDGTEYLLDDLSDNAKAQLMNIQFVDAQIQQLNNEWAVADTARIGYTSALKSELEKNKDNSSSMAQKIKLGDKEYDAANLSDKGKAVLNLLQFSTQKLQELNNMQAFLTR